MKYNNKRNYPKKDKIQKDEGMTVTVRNNDVNGALRILKKKLMIFGQWSEENMLTYCQNGTMFSEKE